MSTLAQVVAEISRAIDEHPANAARDPEARTWGRLAKVGEECGEVVSAYIGFTAQNPRKGQTHTLDDVRNELFDVALTAFAAWEHLSGNEGRCIEEFIDFTLKRKQRLDAGEYQPKPCACLGLSHRNDCPNWVLPL